MKKKKLPKERKRGQSTVVVASLPAEGAESLDAAQTLNSGPLGEEQPVGSKRLTLAALALGSALALWASFPPLGLGWLGWIAPIGWLAIARQKEPLRAFDYCILWLSGVVFWLAIWQGVRLAFWPLYFGWIALSVYLAIYIPLFVAGTRILLDRGLLGRRVPLVLAAPVAWVGLEVVRGYFLTGFCAGGLGYTQVHYPAIIQLADQLGSYGISFVMLTACAAALMLAVGWRSKALGHALPTAVYASMLVGAAIGYGFWRLNEADTLIAERQPLLNVLLVQDNMPTMFESDPESVKLAWTDYLEKTRALTQVRMREQDGQIADLVVWPESTFTAGSPWVESTITTKLPMELEKGHYDVEFVRDWTSKAALEFNWKANVLLSAARGEDYSSLAGSATTGTQAAVRRPHLLLGSDAMEFSDVRIDRFNSALMVGPDAQYIGRYDKMHLVMFGEYIPLGPWLQWLRDIFGLSGATPGKEAKCFEVQGARVAPNICFESMMPRIISTQVRNLVRRAEPPDMLINVTNDSWFRGSSVLDHHLACSVLCAVENRRPLLVAANSGISAEIDGCGRILQSTQRFAADGIWARPIADARWGLVQQFGYPFGWLCALVVVFIFGRRLLGSSRPAKAIPRS